MISALEHARTPTHPNTHTSVLLPLALHFHDIRRIMRCYIAVAQALSGRVEDDWSLLPVAVLFCYVWNTSQKEVQWVLGLNISSKLRDGVIQIRTAANRELLK